MVGMRGLTGLEGMNGGPGGVGGSAGGSGGGAGGLGNSLSMGGVKGGIPSMSSMPYSYSQPPHPSFSVGTSVPPISPVGMPALPGTTAGCPLFVS